uniref:RNA exonuclease NEF-sp-like n=1 Tax=Saccoglossus kowalevskii TaxID=10224 RepID=A0ABM0GL17_SACKO
MPDSGAPPLPPADQRASSQSASAGDGLPDHTDNNEAVPLKVFTPMGPIAGPSVDPSSHGTRFAYRTQALVEDKLRTLQVRWCKILRWTKISSVVMVVLNSVSQEHFEKYPECFTNTRAIFDMSVPVIPSKNSFIYDFLYVPLSKTKIKKLMNSDEKDKQNGGIMNEFNNGDESDFDDVRLPDRRGYVLTQEMMMMNGFPTENEKNFKSTNYSETLSKDSPMFGLDCEMCQTKKGHELTRISLVDEKYNVLYDTLVKPKRPIIDYLTQYSGVTKEMLDPIETRLKDVQQKLISLLPPDAILVGHSLESDLQAIKMYHPNVIDTSVLFIGRNQHKLSLRNLSAVYLKKSIQGGIDGHDSIEDANAAMKLVQLKIEKGPSLQSYHDMTRRQVESFFRTIYREDVDGSMLDNISNVRQFKSDPVSTIPCCNDKEALRKLPGALHLGKFTWLQLHSLNTVLQGVTLDDNTIS